MTERRPSDESVDDFVERQIREAQARGEFDDLTGAGRPIPGIADGGRADDEGWWLNRKIAEENALELPPALQARYAKDAARHAIETATSEVAVRRIVTTANATILRINRTAGTGPPTDTMPFDVETAVQAWHDDPNTSEQPEALPSVAPPHPVGRLARIVARLTKPTV